MSSAAAPRSARNCRSVASSAASGMLLMSPMSMCVERDSRKRVVAEIDEPLDQGERVVELLAGLQPSRDAKGHERTGPAAEILPRERVTDIVRESGVVHPLHARIGAQKFRHPPAVLDVAIDAQR